MHNFQSFGYGSQPFDCFFFFFFQTFNLRQDGTAHLGLLPLRVEFVQTLCIADKLGFLDSIEHVAMELHTQRQKPIKMPYISLPKLRNKLKKSPPPPQGSADQPCDAESLKDDSTVVIQEAGHSLPLSEPQDDPNSFLKEKDSDVESAPETDRLSSTSDKSDASQELTVNCTHSPQSSNGVVPAIDIGFSGKPAVLQSPAAKELSAGGGGRDTGSELGAGGGGCSKRRDKKHRRHPKTATHGGSKQFGRNKKQADYRTEKAKAPVILYYGMGAGRFCT